MSAQNLTPQQRVIGRDVKRLDVEDKVRGRAGYIVDVPWVDTLHGAVVRADRAHAYVTAIRAEEALAMPGVKAVVTGADLDGLFAYFGHYRADHQILALEKVRYFGEPVAVVIADTLQHALDAVNLVDVEYDSLDELMDAEQALAPGVDLIHEYPSEERAFGPFCDRGAEGTNEAFTSTMDWGDVEAAMAQAAHIQRTRVEYPMLYPYPMEPYAAQARFSSGVLEVESNAQHLFQVQKDLARVFSLPLNQVRITSMTIGGGYGAKSYSKVEPLAAVCAHVTGRPVRLVLTLEESMYTSRADGAVVEVATGFDDRGRILARDIDITLDTGAYADNSVRVLRKSLETCFGPYRVPALRVRGRAVYTNTTPASSYRGFGAFHTNPASEGNLDQAAEALGIDPLEIRLRNLAKAGESIMPDSRPLDADLAADLVAVHEALEVIPREGKLHGVGFGCALSPEGADPTSVAIVRLLVDGSALLMIGSTEMGQGGHTTLAQIVAEELGLELDKVRLAPIDTHLVPFQWTTGASRTTAVVGRSVQRACQDVRRQLAEMAAQLAADSFQAGGGSDGGVDGPSAEPEQWSESQSGTGARAAAEPAAAGNDGRTQGQQLPSWRIIEEWFGPNRGEVVGTGRTQKRGDLDQVPSLWEVGIAGVVVSVDPQTGQIELDQLVTIADVGKAINPKSVRGQDLGAATQAIGGALFEEVIYDGSQMANANLIEYRVPRISDLAGRIETMIMERGDGPGPYGSKPVGEGAMTVVGGAILSAVARATGQWPDRLPLTPEYVWTLLARASDGSK
jgi:CO/xanthine dehydrogenase Mo-binding subunit